MAACFALVAAVSWKWVLQSAARFLIHSGSTGQATLIVSIAGVAGLEQASTLLQANPNLKLLLTDQAPTRVEELGVLRDDLAQTREQLKRLQVEETRVLPPLRQTDGVNDMLAALGEHLQQHPEEQLVILCGEWRSRLLRLKCNRLPVSFADRISVQAVDDPAVDPGAWWSTRQGIRTVCSSGIQYLAAWGTFTPGQEYPMRTQADFQEAAVASP